MPLLLVAAILAAGSFEEARAQDGAATYEASPVDADLLAPSVGGRTGLVLDDAQLSGPWGVDLRLQGRAQAPYRLPSGDDAVINGLGSMNLGVGLSWWRLSVYGDLPVGLVGRPGDLEGGGLGELSPGTPGELRLGVVGVGRPGGPRQLGVALGGAALLPVSEEGQRWRSSAPAGPAAELELIADLQLGPALLVANVGGRLQPDQTLPWGSWGHLLQAGVGVAVDPWTHVGFSAELHGATPLADPFALATSPVEGLGALRFHLGEGVELRLGGGGGVTSAPGTPQWRATGALSWSWRASEDRDGDGLLNRADDCPAEPEDRDLFEDDDGCPDPDNDGDGLVDTEDPCPDRPEDVDGLLDGDGCPDGASELLLEISGPARWRVEDPQVALYPLHGDDGLDPHRLRGEAVERPLRLVEGPWLLTVEAPGYRALEEELRLPGAGRLEHLAVLIPEEGVGVLRLRTVDESGLGMEAHVAFMDQGEALVVDDGDMTFEVPVGQHHIKVYAPDHGHQDKLVNIKEDQVTTAAVMLYPGGWIWIEGDEIKLDDAIYFEFGEAVIQPRSYAMLDELARTLRRNPQLLRVRVEGHTDWVDTDEFNLDLSQRRAEAVVDYLVDAGVDEGRLDPIGFGEAFPIDTNETEDGRANNRRVAFFVDQRRGEPAPEDVGDPTPRSVPDP